MLRSILSIFRQAGLVLSEYPKMTGWNFLLMEKKS